MTLRDLILLAMKSAGVAAVGQAPLAEDTNDAFTHLNMMLAQWSRQGYIVYHELDVSLIATGAAQYTVGPGGDFNLSRRPPKIESAYVRLLNSPSVNRIDVPLGQIGSYEDYGRVKLKSFNAFPRVFYYDPAVPLGLLHVIAVPSNIYELHIVVHGILDAFVGLTDVITLPDEYQDALLWHLAQRLRVSYRLPPDSKIDSLAMGALATIRGENFRMPRARIPRGVPGRGRGGVIFSGTGVDVPADWS